MKKVLRGSTNTAHWL